MSSSFKPNASVVLPAHGPFLAAAIRPGQPVSLRHMTSPEHGAPVNPTLWRLSPLGVEVCADSTLELGTLVSVGLTMVNDEVDLAGHVVGVVPKIGSNQFIIGIRFSANQAAPQSDDDRRQAARFRCSPFFYPVVTAKNLAQFHDVYYFRVADISVTGVTLISSLRNKHLVPGMEIDIQALFPTVGEFAARLKIVNIRTHGDSGVDAPDMLIGASFVKLPSTANEIIGQYLMTFGSHEQHATSVTMLRNQGFRLRSVADSLDFDYCNTDAEYRQVLTLRAMAYGGAGKTDPNAPIDSFQDIFDSKARILIAKHKGKVVASMRLIYCDQLQDFEHAQFVDLAPFAPPPTEMVEITRVCTHPDFRGQDVLLALFRHALVTTVQSGRFWIMGSASKKLIPIYKMVGCTILDATYTYEKLGGEKHHLFLFDLKRILSGEGINPISWHVVVAPTWHVLEKSGLLDARLGAYRTFRAHTMLRLAPLWSLMYEIYERSRERKRRSRQKASHAKAEH